ncbi:MAG TPA: NTP transferase domain-containing protein [Thermoanaerobaculia bacterium]
MISAIILAAGQATRFGSSKQLAPIDGKPLLQHVLDNLAQSKIDDVVVVLGANADEIRKLIRFGRARVVMNPEFADGMSTSIHAALRAIDADAAMIVLADQPFVSSRTIDALIDEVRRTGAKVMIPTFNGFRGNPVVIDRSLFAEMMEIRGDVGCRSIFGNHEVTKLAVDDRGILMDIDTPSDVILSREDGEGSGRGTDDLLETILDLRNRRQPFAIATVVRAERPTSSKPGDKAIISPDGTLTGWIGGSCAHDIVVRNALESLEEGSPRFLTLSSASPSEVKRQCVIDVPMQCYSGGVLDVFIEPNLPKPQMVVVGYETVARALVRISKTLQFHVTVVDPLATKQSVPEADAIVNELKLTEMQLGGESFIVIATHGRYDEEALEQAARTNASYIALVASPKRAGTILQILRDRGVNVDRIKSPAGLDIGAQGAEEIALSIVAEIVQQRRSQEATAVAKEPVVEEAIDPICNMTVEIAGARYTALHDGRTYYFCCAHCQRTFEKDPHRYAHVA